MVLLQTSRIARRGWSTLQLLLRKLAILERYLLDCAASEFYKDGMYDLDFKNPASDKSQWLTGQ